MHKPTCIRIEYGLFVAESSYLEGYPAATSSTEFAEEEIAAIRSVLQKLTAIRILNPNDAEDLVQDTLLTMLTKKPGSELEKGLLVWSMGILRKKVGNYYRKVQRYTCFSEQDKAAQQSTAGFSITTASPESRILHNELQFLIDQALTRLPASQRQAIELLIDGFDSGEIAQQLNPERYQNVINHIYRGRRKLAKELARYGYGPEAKSGMTAMKKCRPRRGRP